MMLQVQQTTYVLLGNIKELLALSPVLVEFRVVGKL
jgi:hypothetical protein